MNELIIVFMVLSFVLIILSNHWKHDNMCSKLAMLSSVALMGAIATDDTLIGNEQVLLIVVGVSLFLFSLLSIMRDD